MTKTLVGSPDPDDQRAYSEGIFKRLAGQKKVKTDEDGLAAQMRKNRQASMRKSAASGSTGTTGPQSLSFATGRPRDPMFYWRQNNLPYDVTKDEELKKIREYCSSPLEKVWMGDYSFKPIGEIQPGDEVIGWAPAEPGKRSRLVRSTVLAVNHRIAPETVKITTEAGRTWTGTPDHKFANPYYSPGSKGNPKGGWTQPEFVNPKEGTVLRHVIEITPELDDQKLREVAAWLGGVYDGEGTGERVAQSITHNPGVYERTAHSLDLLGLRYNRRPMGLHLSTGMDRGTNSHSRQQMVDFLNWTNPTRRQTTAIDTRLLSASFGSQDRIASVESLGEGPVVSMQTSTGNYVVSGFASSNCRLLYMTHPIIASCIDIYSKYPLLGMELTCKDEQLKDFYEKLFMEDLGYEDFLIDVGREYWTVGEAWPFGSFNEMLGVWEHDELLNPDDIEVERSPFLKEPRFEIRLPESLRKIITEKQPAWEYERLMQSYPELANFSSPDSLMPVSNVLLKQLKFKADTFHKRGLPILMRAFRSIMQEEMLMAAMDAIADRLYTPLILVKLGASATDLGTEVPWIPTEDDLADFEEALDGALAGDFRVITHHFGIEMAPVFGRENMPDMTSDFERIEERILQTFGLSKTMLSGADGGETYAADALNRDLISQLLTTYQRNIRELYEDRARVVAEAQEHYDYELRNGRRYPIMEEVLEMDDETGEYRIVEQPKLLIPELRFKTMNMADEESERDFLESLREAGVPISMKRRTISVGIDIDEEVELVQEEQVQLAVAEQETRKRTFQALRSAGLPIPQDLLDDFLPRASNTMDSQQRGASEQAEEGVRSPMLGLDPTMQTPNLAPTAEDGMMPDEENGVDQGEGEMGGGAGPGMGMVIPLPQNQMMNRVEESDEQRGKMPKASSISDGPRHVGMRKKAGIDANTPLDGDADPEEIEG